MLAIPTYFTCTARKGIRSAVVQGYGLIHFSRMRVDVAADLWEEGSKYVHITKEGAKLLYGELTPKELADKLQLCRTPDEVAALASLKPTNKALKEAVQNRVNELLGTRDARDAAR